MPETTLKNLNELAKSGANIVFHRSLPRDVPGFANLKKRRKQFNKLAGTDRKEWRGNFWLTDSICVTLDAVKIKPELLKQNGLQFIRKKYGD